MQVIKFGGTSVARPEKLVDIVSKAIGKDRTILVCSAISGCTDALIALGNKAAAKDKGYLEDLEALKEKHFSLAEQLLDSASLKKTLAVEEELFASLSGILHGVYLLGELSKTSLDAVQSFGELFSTRILEAKFASLGISCKWLDARGIIISDAGVVDTSASYANIEKAIAAHARTKLFIVPGFIASDSIGRTTTLGRGGSDYTAALFAAGIKARLVEIWTDVPGIMTANPKTVPGAKTVRNISYRAAQELSHFGAKVIFPPTIQPVVAEGIPIYVKNTFDPDDEGTLVEKNPPRQEDALLGISNSDKIALISLEGSGMVGIPGFSSRLFDALSRAGINIILITQASSVHTMCIAIAEKDAPLAKKAADDCFAYEISMGKINPLKVEPGYSIVCLVGDNILGHSGATGRMLSAIDSAGIRVRATAQGSSERNISVIVPSENAEDAIRAIHKEFFEKAPARQVHLYIAGYGQVGKALVKIIKDNALTIAERTGKELIISGVANSKRYLINPVGVDASALAEGTEGSFFEALEAGVPPASIFVDCTASSTTALHYAALLDAGVKGIVACNKLPFAGSWQSYKQLCRSAAAHGAGLRYETTVGAALPILDTLERIACSGDKLKNIEAVVSGSLNYLCNNYKGEDLAAVVEDARAKGYTEPDPEEDLSGRDVLRKLIIMARVSGFAIEEKDIDARAFPRKEAIKHLYTKAIERGNRLRYVARLQNTKEGIKASIGIEEIGPESPLYKLDSTDNCAVITTEQYPNSIVIRGAGAGPEQTAGGVLSDILKII